MKRETLERYVEGLPALKESKLTGIRSDLPLVEPV
jgi:hypothetical protein